MKIARFLGASVVTAGILSAANAGAAEITVTHWGTQFYGAPFSVAFDKGWFEGECGEVDGVLTSTGGGTSVRNTLASSLPYGEVALPAAVQAIQSGQDIVIIHSGVGSVDDALWAAKAGSEIDSIDDLKGKRVGYTRPKSVSNMLLLMALDKAGIGPDEVEMIAIGGTGANLTAIMTDAVDAGYTAEPIWSREKEGLQPVFWARDLFPDTGMMQTVGITTRAYAEENPEMISCIVEARRKGVDFIYENPEEAAELVAEAYQMDAELLRTVFAELVESGYWEQGAFDFDAMDRMVEGMILVGEIDGEMDWTEVVSDQYLPDDLRSAETQGAAGGEAAQ